MKVYFLQKREIEKAKAESEDKRMKKVYKTPVVDKVNFDYKNQVVASGCIRQWGYQGDNCHDHSTVYDNLS